MNRTGLKAVICFLDSRVYKLESELKIAEDDPERVDAVANMVQRMLDEAQQRLDDARMLEVWNKHMARFPETMGNMFRAIDREKP